MKLFISFLGTTIVILTIYSVFEIRIKMYLPVWKDRITCTVKTRRCFVSFIFTLRKSIVILAEDQLAIHCISFQDTLFMKCTSSTILDFVTLALRIYPTHNLGKNNQVGCYYSWVPNNRVYTIDVFWEISPIHGLIRNIHGTA